MSARIETFLRTHAELLAEICDEKPEILQYKLHIVLTCLRWCRRFVLILDDLVDSNLAVGC